MNRTGRSRGSGASGRWLVIAIIGGAVVLGLVAIRFSRFIPRPLAPATGPTTVNG